MAAGRRSCFFACVSVLLLGGRLYDVEASPCDRVIAKKVGDTVELPSCAPTEGVSLTTWRYNGSIIAKSTVLVENQFAGRLDLNPTSFNLAVRQLTRKDSGVFQFLSDVNDKESETVTINLTVYEPISKEPVVTFNSTRDAKSNSCTVTLTCSATSGSSVTYIWTVRNEIIRGSRMDYNITPEDGDTTFTCTVSNVVSEMSRSTTEKCSNLTTTDPESRGWSAVPLLVRVLFGASSIGLPLLLHCFLRSKGCIGRASPPQRDHQKDSVLQPEAQEPVYACPLPGDDSVYHSIHGGNAEGCGADAPLQTIRLGGEYEAPDEDSHYDDVNPDPAGEVQRRQIK